MKKNNCLIYGGTSGFGLELAKLLVLNCDVTVTGKKTNFKNEFDINYLNLDCNSISFSEINNKFLENLTENLNLIVFNVGGSFGNNEKIANPKHFDNFANQNLKYIIDTIYYLESKNKLNNLTLVFMLTKGLKINNGNPLYLMMKSALKTYIDYLKIKLAFNKINFIAVYPPLILYENRYLSIKYHELTTKELKKEFILKRLGGFKPITPENLARIVHRKIYSFLN